MTILSSHSDISSFNACIHFLYQLTSFCLHFFPPLHLYSLVHPFNQTLASVLSTLALLPLSGTHLAEVQSWVLPAACVLYTCTGFCFEFLLEKIPPNHADYIKVNSWLLY